jgi:hypothetical protein
MDGAIDGIGAGRGSTHALPLPWLCLSSFFPSLPLFIYFIGSPTHTITHILLFVILYIHFISLTKYILGINIQKSHKLLVVFKVAL